MASHQPSSHSFLQLCVQCLSLDREGWVLDGKADKPSGDKTGQNVSPPKELASENTAFLCGHMTLTTTVSLLVQRKVLAPSDLPMLSLRPIIAISIRVVVLFSFRCVSYSGEGARLLSRCTSHRSRRLWEIDDQDCPTSHPIDIHISLHLPL